MVVSQNAFFPSQLAARYCCAAHYGQKILDPACCTDHLQLKDLARHGWFWF
jgi:hypothetical protein